MRIVNGKAIICAAALLLLLTIITKGQDDQQRPTEPATRPDEGIRQDGKGSSESWQATDSGYSNWFRSFRQQVELDLAPLNEKEQLNYFERHFHDIDDYLSFCFVHYKEHPGLTAQIYELLAWRKGLVAANVRALRAEAALSRDGKSRFLLDEIQKKRTELEGLVYSQLATADEASSHAVRVRQLEKELPKETNHQTKCEEETQCAKVADDPSREICMPSACATERIHEEMAFIPIAQQEASRVGSEAYYRSTREKIRVLANEIDELDKEIVRHVSALGGSAKLGDSPVSWQRIQKSLKQGEAAIEFGHLTSDRSDHYLALVITPQTIDGPALVELGDRSRLQNALREYQQYKWSSDSPGRAGRDDLYGTVWEPLEHFLNIGDTVYLATDEELNEVSFGIVTDYQDHRLLEKYKLRVVNSTKDLLPVPQWPNTSSAVLVGNPKFFMGVTEHRLSVAALKKSKFRVGPRLAANATRASRRSETADPCGQRPRGGLLCPVLRSGDEVQSIYRLLKDQGWHVDKPFVGAYALEEVVKGVHHPRVLHLATHGFFLAKNGLRTALDGWPSVDPWISNEQPKVIQDIELPLPEWPVGPFNFRTTALGEAHVDTPSNSLLDDKGGSESPQAIKLERTSESLDPASLAQSVIQRDPMLRSGLYFAGADRVLKKQRSLKGLEDGILTASEMAGLDLHGTELVVLSACDTGLGEMKAGEEIFGLRRALQEAGAQSALMSVWPVRDEPTQQLMELFYTNWLSGMEKHDALREAQLTLRKTYSNPIDWGGFLLIEFEVNTVDSRTTAQPESNQ